MYKYLICIISLIMLNTTIADDYRQNVIIVKVKQNTTTHKMLQENPDKFNNLFNDILGSYKFETYISQNTLNALALMETKKSNNLQSLENANSSLGRIYRITYSNNLDPKFISRKLNNYSDFEYIEPEPISNLFSSKPNDSLYYEQYALDLIKAPEAWDSLKTNDTIIVAICDTGVDWFHEDLRDVIYTNIGETGKDSKGKDKNSNGIDDDGNGFVDDWHGWNVAGNGTVADNNTKPRNDRGSHGTFIAGIVGARINNFIGIAGVAQNVKILPVKILLDTNYFYLKNEYEGILYSYIAGASVANCSWGSDEKSSANQEIINYVSNGGMLVVAPAGNTGKENLLYPASYKRVLSVASTNWNDRKSTFSTYNSEVDLTAPGNDIYSTMPYNQYESYDGTSYASAIVSGVAAMARLAFPNMDIDQISELLKASTDNIYSINNYNEKIGKGRVNALNTILNKGAKSVLISNKSLIDSNNDGNYDANEKVYLNFDIKNELKSLTNIRIEIKTSSVYLDFGIQSINVGDLKTKDFLSFNKNTKQFDFTINKLATKDAIIGLTIEIYESDNLISFDYLTFTINSSYRNLITNNVKTTLNSYGNIGFDDYPENRKGMGFKYKNSNNLLNEGGLIIATGYDRVWDVVNNEVGDYYYSGRSRRKNQDFYTVDPINVVETYNKIFTQNSFKNYIDNSFQDSLLDKLFILQTTIQPKLGVGADDVIYVTYDVRNDSERDLDSLFVGLFLDWDLSVAGYDDVCVWESNVNYGIIYNAYNDSTPCVAVKLLSNEKQNFYALDNYDFFIGRAGIVNGFTKDEKWQTLTRKLIFSEIGVTDISMVNSAGPIKLARNETKKITFAITVAPSKNLIDETVKNGIRFARDNGMEYSGPIVINEDYKSLNFIAPNPFNDKLIIDVNIGEIPLISWEIYDLLGRSVIPYNFQIIPKGLQTLTINNLSNLSPGVYIIEIQIGGVDGPIYRQLIQKVN